MEAKPSPAAQVGQGATGMDGFALAPRRWGLYVAVRRAHDGALKGVEPCGRSRAA